MSRLTALIIQNNPIDCLAFYNPFKEQYGYGIVLSEEPYRFLVTSTSEPIFFDAEKAIEAAEEYVWEIKNTEL